MPGLFITDETLVRATRWKLGISREDDPQAGEVWTGFLAVPRNQYLVEELAAFLVDPVR